MLFSWLLDPTGGLTGCCQRSQKDVSCLRSKDWEGGNICEYDPHGQTKASAAELLVTDRPLPGGLPSGPVERTVPTYATGQEAAVSTALEGSPSYAGDLLRLSLGDSIQEVRMAIYVNGFIVGPRDAVSMSPQQLQQKQICRVWSPFSLVEKCQVRARQDEAQWAIFKVTVFRREGQDASFYFATAGSDAQSQRNRWVEEIVQAISNLTLSLFPRFELSVDPVPGRVATSTRIMAGYLLQGGAGDRASLVFCELHAYLGRESRLALYKDDWCEQEVLSITISDSSVVSTRKGAYCTVFGINDQLFCARTEDERELWLRAVSNIKVKLMFDAPTPTMEELEVFRSAVHERIEALPPPLPPGGPAAAEAFAAQRSEAGREFQEPVLAEVPRMPPAGPRGDTSASPDPGAAEEVWAVLGGSPVCGGTLAITSTSSPSKGKAHGVGGSPHAADTAAGGRAPAAAAAVAPGTVGNANGRGQLEANAEAGVVSIGVEIEGL